MLDAKATIDFNAGRLICSGDWCLPTLSILMAKLEALTFADTTTLVWDGTAIGQLDSAGAWLILHWQRRLRVRGYQISHQHFSDTHQKILDLVSAAYPTEKIKISTALPNLLAQVGRVAVGLSMGLLRYLYFVGQLTVSLVRHVKGSARWQPAALATQILRTGLQALPIIGLLSCLVGVVLAYQLGVQLQSYGANIFIPDLLGLSVLREFGPLLTAIMVAGRTGSAFTAELGMMKINQEIDALRTMGYLPDTLLILPRVLGLVITLPLLVLWADIFGVLGGMVMSHAMLDLSWHAFLDRLQHQVPLRALVIGLCKAPVFALLIAGVGCFQGMAVTGTAESLGKNTTRSVVLAIFFIILADAAFSIVFSWWGL